MVSSLVLNSECCPEFDPIQWDDKIFYWDNKKFIRTHVSTLFYMPINFDKAIKRLDQQVKVVGATILDELCLADHTSKWNMDIYLAVDKKVEEVNNTALSGKFYSKVYEGSFKDTGKWRNDFEIIIKSKGMTIKKWYMWYTTCPKCAKKYGKNYVVVFGQVK